MQTANRQRLLRGTGAYLVIGLLQRASSLVLLPFFARVLTSAEYGQIGIVATVSGAVVAIVGFGLESSVVRTLVRLRREPEEARRFLATVSTFAIVVPPVLGMMAAIPIGVALERPVGSEIWWVGLGILAASVNASVTVVAFAVMRAEERLVDYVRLGTLQVATNLALPFVFVVLLRWGVGGWFTGAAIGSIATLLVAIRFQRAVLGLAFDRSVLAGALAFGIPMIPHALSHWALALSDRVVLGALVPTADVGVYHVAYQFGLPVALVAGAMSQSLQPMYVEASSAAGGAVVVQLRRLGSVVVICTGLLGVSVALLGPPILQGLLPPDYSKGASLIPWVALGTVFYGWYFLPMNSITMLAGRTRWVWMITALAATTNVVLNLMLVPRLGVLGAAFNTAIGYGVLLLGVTWYARRVATQGPSYELGRLALGLAIVLLPCPLLALGGEPVVQIAVRTLALVATAIALVVTGLVPLSLGLHADAG